MNFVSFVTKNMSWSPGSLRYIYYVNIIYKDFPSSFFLQPCVCTRELCVFAFQTLGVMADAAEAIATDADVRRLIGESMSEPTLVSQLASYYTCCVTALCIMSVFCPCQFFALPTMSIPRLFPFIMSSSTFLLPKLWIY